MSSIVLDVTDESMLTRIKNACAMLKGVGCVKVIKSGDNCNDITKTSGYREAMDDVKKGRVYRAESTEAMFQQILNE